MDDVAANDRARHIAKGIDSTAVIALQHDVMDMVVFAAKVPGGRGLLITKGLVIVIGVPAGILFPPSPADGNARVRQVANFVVGDHRSIRIPRKDAHPSGVLDGHIMNIVVHDLVVFHDFAGVARMMINHVANLDSGTRDVVKLTARNDVVLRAVLQVDSATPELGEGTALEANRLRGMQDDVRGTLAVLIVEIVYTPPIRAIRFWGLMTKLAWRSTRPIWLGRNQDAWQNVRPSN